MDRYFRTTGLWLLYIGCFGQWLTLNHFAGIWIRDHFTPWTPGQGIMIFALVMLNGFIFLAIGYTKHTADEMARINKEMESID